jgi:hypothetical protein
MQYRASSNSKDVFFIINGQMVLELHPLGKSLLNLSNYLFPAQ